MVTRWHDGAMAMAKYHISCLNADTMETILTH